MSKEQAQFALWIHKVDSNQARRATFDQLPVLDTAAWSGDGRYLYFGDGDRVWRVDSQGQEAPRALVEGWSPHVSPNGRYLVYLSEKKVQYLDLERGSAPVPFLEGPEYKDVPRLSPDGRLLAYVSDESGREEVWVRTFPSGEGRWQISTEGGDEPRWSADGDEIFFARHRDLMAVPVETGNGFSIGLAKKLFTLSSPSFYEYAVTPDGDFVAVLPGEESSTLAVVDQWRTFFESGGATESD